MTEDSIKKESTSGKPKATKGDYSHSLARAVISLIPIAGGPINEFFNHVIQPPLSKHLIEWVESIEKGLNELHKKFDTFKLESLSDDSVFATKFSYAMQIAIRNHQEDKLNALRNSLLNTALTKPTNPEEALQHMFFNFIDTFSVYHLKILKCLNDPLEWFKQNKLNTKSLPLMGSVSSMLETAFPELREDFYNQIVKDLIDKGLVQDFSLHLKTPSYGITYKRITSMGERFLDFLTSPILED